MDDPTRARFTDVQPGAGFYESYYLRASHPSEPLGIWIRYTVHKRPGAKANGSLWFTLFDANSDGPRATKITVPDLEVGADSYIQIARSTFGKNRVLGSAGPATWDLQISDGAPELLHLPYGWMYTAKIPRTKTLSPHPAALISGGVSINGRSVDLDRWPGMIGHNWGAEHAERWVWMHGIGFEGEANDTWLDVAVGRVKVGPLTTPWIGSGAISAQGRRYQLGGAERIRSTEMNESPTGCQFKLPGDGITVLGNVGSDAKNFVGWVYADPGGSEHNTANCSIAEMRLTVQREGEPDLQLHSPSGATYEIGMRETDHGIPIQPFPDG